jgi:hypothetical protein
MGGGAVQRMFKVLAVAVLAATVLVMASIPAFARPQRGGLPVQNEELCAKMIDEKNQQNFVPTAPIGPPPEVDAECWHISQGPGLVVASDPPPPDPPPVRD